LIFEYFFEICREKIQFSLKSDKNEDQYTFFIIFRSIHVRMKKMLKKKLLEKFKTHFISNIFFLNHAVYEIMWRNIVQPGRPDMTIWRMRIAYWISKDTHTHTHTHTHSQHVILLAFPLQQSLQESVSMLRYAYIVCLDTNSLVKIGQI